MARIETESREDRKRLWQRNVPSRRTYVRWVLMMTLAFGVLLHAAALIAGRQWMLDHLLTPAFEPPSRHTW